MSRLLTTKDGYQIINLLNKELSGQNATIQAVDSSTFVSAGETAMAAGTDNVINTLSLILSTTIVDADPYTAKFAIMRALNSGVYSNRLRKISFYSKNAVTDGASNTDLLTNLADGFDNGTNPTNLGVDQSAPNMWQQSAPVSLELNFAGSTEWQYVYTLYEYQLKNAFRSDADWTAFLNGFITEVGNDIETEKEAFSRMTLLNYIGGLYDLSASMPGSVINMTSLFNTTFGTSHTTAQLQTTYFAEFLAFFVEQVKTISDMMTNRQLNYHWSPSKTVGGVSYNLLRHTPKADQKMIMVSKFWNAAEARVLPQIFNDQYLKLSNFEKVDFWQNINDPYAVKITPAIPDTSDPTEQTAGTAVNLGCVLGILYDKDALMVDFQLDDVASTPLEARKHFRNIWHTIRKNAINDFTENGVLFYMAD